MGRKRDKKMGGPLMDESRSDLQMLSPLQRLSYERGITDMERNTIVYVLIMLSPVVLMFILFLIFKLIEFFL
jgi:hypothetical protein